MVYFQSRKRLYHLVVKKSHKHNNLQVGTWDPTMSHLALRILLSVFYHSRALTQPDKYRIQVQVGNETANSEEMVTDPICLLRISSISPESFGGSTAPRPIDLLSDSLKQFLGQIGN